MAECKLLTQIMAEHVRMPGAPQVIVERGWLYQWLTNTGLYPDRHGFASVEWAAMGSCRPEVDEPLTDEAERDRFAALLAQSGSE